MTDTLRNMPRYIRNTDAFGWQGADGPNGPWRSIAPPQSGTPWQPGSPMDDLRQASADVSGVEILSPAAQAVLTAFNDEKGWLFPREIVGSKIAAALRAAADQVVPEHPMVVPGGRSYESAWSVTVQEDIRKKFLALPPSWRPPDAPRTSAPGRRDER